MPCLAWNRVINGEHQPCENCAPHLDKVRGLLGVKDLVHSGFAGVNKDGRIVDRREDPSAVAMAENSFFGIPKPL